MFHQLPAVVAGQFSDLNQSTEVLAQDHKRQEGGHKEKEKGKIKGTGIEERRGKILSV
jgi:hypothetical protein